jgi:hypothetical protein
VAANKRLVRDDVSALLPDLRRIAAARWREDRKAPPPFLEKPTPMVEIRGSDREPREIAVRIIQACRETNVS